MDELRDEQHKTGCCSFYLCEPLLHDVQQMLLSKSA